MKIINIDKLMADANKFLGYEHWYYEKDVIRFILEGITHAESAGSYNCDNRIGSKFTLNEFIVNCSFEPTFNDYTYFEPSFKVIKNELNAWADEGEEDYNLIEIEYIS
jgi:hypothetical protein